MKIVLLGYGKMGRAVETVAVERGHEIVLAIGQHEDALTMDSLRKADVAIEFTAPSAAMGHLLRCFDAGIPVVCGTTGWLAHWDEIAAACRRQNGALVYASNFSIGVNLFFELNKFLAGMMSRHPAYDVALQEIHHTEKKDAPSGTAITLAEQILPFFPSMNGWVNHAPAQPGELTIESTRQGNTPGTHIVTYRSAIDDIAIIHTAHSRAGFAAGAVLAAEFLQGKKGVYTMKDVLGL